jgi:hypothetical protein
LKKVKEKHLNILRAQIFLMKSSIERKSTKQKISKFIMTSLILTESILISCERFNNKGENMASKSIEQQKETKNPLNQITYSKIEGDKKIILNENYAKIPNTNMSAKKSGNEIYIKDGEKEHKLDNTKNLSQIFEHNGNIYLTGIKNRYLHFSSYEKNNLKEKTDFSFELIQKNKKIVSHSINLENGKMIIKGKEGESNEINFTINLDSLETFRDYNKNN